MNTSCKRQRPPFGSECLMIFYCLYTLMNALWAFWRKWTCFFTDESKHCTLIYIGDQINFTLHNLGSKFNQFDKWPINYSEIAVEHFTEIWLYRFSSFRSQCLLLFIHLKYFSISDWLMHLENIRLTKHTFILWICRQTGKWRWELDID